MSYEHRERCTSSGYSLKAGSRQPLVERLWVRGKALYLGQSNWMNSAVSYCGGET